MLQLRCTGTLLLSVAYMLMSFNHHSALDNVVTLLIQCSVFADSAQGTCDASAGNTCAAPAASPQRAFDWEHFIKTQLLNVKVGVLAHGSAGRSDCRQPYTNWL